MHSRPAAAHPVSNTCMATRDGTEGSISLEKLVHSFKKSCLRKTVTAMEAAGLATEDTSD